MEERTRIHEKKQDFLSIGCSFPGNVKEPQSDNRRIRHCRLPRREASRDVHEWWNALNGPGITPYNGMQRGRRTAQGRNAPEMALPRRCIVIQFYCIFMQARPRTVGRAFDLSDKESAAMKDLRHNAIRELVAHSAVTNQDELRRKLRRRGFRVTQATLSRDIHELRLSKGPGAYSLPNGNAHGAGAAVIVDAPPTVEEMLDSFGMRVQQAMNQVIVRTVMGGAQPVAAALDRTDWPEVVGTIAGDETRWGGC